MNQSSLSRWSLLSGIIFVILFVVGSFQLGQIGYLPEAEEVAAFLSSNANGLAITSYLGTLSAFFLWWFAGSLRGVLRSAGQNHDPLADIAFGGGVAAGVLLVVAFSSLLGLAQRAGTATGIDPGAATVMLDSSGLGTGLPVAFAAFIGATGLALVRTRLLPVWVGWVSVILGIGLLTPISYALIPLILLWTIVISLWLFIRGGQESAPAA